MAQGTLEVDICQEIRGQLLESGGVRTADCTRAEIALYDIPSILTYVAILGIDESA